MAGVSTSALETRGPSIAVGEHRLYAAAVSDFRAGEELIHLTVNSTERIRRVMHVQPLRREDRHIEQWISVEHYRLDCAERWPDSDYKKAVFAAIHSTLRTLEAAPAAPVEQRRCIPCASRQAPTDVLELASRSQSPIASTRLAA